jgi:CRISPR-associated protein Cas2
MIQPKTGVFVGGPSARVRELLWSKTIRSLKDGAALLIYSNNTEQGFTIQSYGKTSKIITDFEGILLPKTPISG